MNGSETTGWIRAALAIGLLAVGVEPAVAGGDSSSANVEPDAAEAFELDHALARPIFDRYYACGEHREGELEYLGDALGADCAIQELEKIDGREFARLFRGDGSANEDWYGWGADVLAPCSGEVVRINVNQTVNQPGILGKPPATFVVLERDDGVHFLLAHLAELTVELGDRVAAGEKLGVVGNNGYGRTPHIHIGAWRGETPLQIRFDLSSGG